MNAQEGKCKASSCSLKDTIGSLFCTNENIRNLCTCAYSAVELYGGTQWNHQHNTWAAFEISPLANMKYKVLF